MPDFNFEKFVTNVQKKLAPISADALGWLAVIVINAVFIPTLLALLMGLSDKVPSVDNVLLTWVGLLLLFGKAAIQNDKLNMVTIMLGFFIQAALMVLIFFK
jgi:hypothetical protein